MQAEDAEGRLHAVGRMDSKEGTNIIIVQFYLTAESQAGNPAGLQRSALAQSFARHLCTAVVPEGVQSMVAHSLSLLSKGSTCRYRMD